MTDDDFDLDDLDAIVQQKKSQKVANPPPKGVQKNTKPKKNDDFDFEIDQDDNDQGYTLTSNQNTNNNGKSSQLSNQTNRGNVNTGLDDDDGDFQLGQQKNSMLPPINLKKPTTLVTEEKRKKTQNSVNEDDDDFQIHNDDDPFENPIDDDNDFFSQNKPSKKASAGPTNTNVSLKKSQPLPPSYSENSKPVTKSTSNSQNYNQQVQKDDLDEFQVAKQQNNVPVQKQQAVVVEDDEYDDYNNDFEDPDNEYQNDFEQEDKKQSLQAKQNKQFNDNQSIKESQVLKNSSNYSEDFDQDLNQYKKNNVKPEDNSPRDSRNSPQKEVSVQKQQHTRGNSNLSSGKKSVRDSDDKVNKSLNKTPVRNRDNSAHNSVSRQRKFSQVSNQSREQNNYHKDDDVKSEKSHVSGQPPRSDAHSEQDLSSLGEAQLIAENNRLRNELKLLNEEITHKIEHNQTQIIKNAVQKDQNYSKQKEKERRNNTHDAEINNNDKILERLLEECDKLERRYEQVSDPDYVMKMKKDCENTTQEIQNTQQEIKKASINNNNTGKNLAQEDQDGNGQGRDLHNFKQELAMLKTQNSEYQRRLQEIEQEIQEKERREQDQKLDEKYQQILKISAAYEIYSDPNCKEAKEQQKYREMVRKNENLTNCINLLKSNREKKEKLLRIDNDELIQELREKDELINRQDLEILQVTNQITDMMSRENIPSRNVRDACVRMMMPYTPPPRTREQDIQIDYNDKKMIKETKDDMAAQKSSHNRDGSNKIDTKPFYSKPNLNLQIQSSDSEHNENSGIIFDNDPGKLPHSTKNPSKPDQRNVSPQKQSQKVIKDQYQNEIVEIQDDEEKKINKENEQNIQLKNETQNLVEKKVQQEPVKANVDVAEDILEEKPEEENKASKEKQEEEQAPVSNAPKGFTKPNFKIQQDPAPAAQEEEKAPQNSLPTTGTGVDAIQESRVWKNTEQEEANKPKEEPPKTFKFNSRRNNNDKSSDFLNPETNNNNGLGENLQTQKSLNPETNDSNNFLQKNEGSSMNMINSKNSQVNNNNNNLNNANSTNDLVGIKPSRMRAPLRGNQENSGGYNFSGASNNTSVIGNDNSFKETPVVNKQSTSPENEFLGQGAEQDEYQPTIGASNTGNENIQSEPPQSFNFAGGRKRGNNNDSNTSGIDYKLTDTNPSNTFENQDDPFKKKEEVKAAGGFGKEEPSLKFGITQEEPNLKFGNAKDEEPKLQFGAQKEEPKLSFGTAAKEEPQLSFGKEVEEKQQYEPDFKIGGTNSRIGRIRGTNNNSINSENQENITNNNDNKFGSNSNSVVNNNNPSSGSGLQFGITKNEPETSYMPSGGDGPGAAGGEQQLNFFQNQNTENSVPKEPETKPAANLNNNNNPFNSNNTAAPAPVVVDDNPFKGPGDRRRVVQQQETTDNKPQVQTRDIFGNNDNDVIKVPEIKEQNNSDAFVIPTIGQEQQKPLPAQSKVSSLDDQPDEALDFLNSDSKKKTQNQAAIYDDEDDIFGGGQSKNNNDPKQNKISMSKPNQKEKISQIAERAQQNDFFNDLDDL